jgi:flagellar M-ring protein FliF
VSEPTDPTAVILARARTLAESGLAWFRALSKPVRAMAIGTTVATLALVVWLSMRAANEPYAVLFSQLDRDDAGAIAAKLKELKIPVKLSPDGSIIEVPEARVAELRLELATAGLPRGGGVGFESFDKLRLGATEFEQRVQFRRALEGELSRTISTVAAVQSARVHIVLPERSVFVSRREAAGASIVVKLRPGRAVGAAEVAGIVHLVASAVPGLAAEAVTLVTTEGVMLHRPRKPSEDGAAGLDPNEPSPARALETTTEERVRAMLDRVLGPGHADVRVSAEYDLSRVERTEDRYDPKTTVLRSEESTVERNTENDANAPAGVPGAESNTPGGAAPVGEAADKKTGIVRESHTRNFEVDHVTEMRITNGGTLRRVTVAVVVDSAHEAGKTVPRTKEEMEKLSALVRSAVGADDRRGDVVTVETVPFTVAEAEAPPPPTPFARVIEKIPPKWITIGSAAMPALGLLLGIIGVMRRRKSKKEDAITAKELATSAAATATPPVLTGEAPVPALEDGRDHRREAHEKAAADAATAALVVRHWLGTTGEDEVAEEARPAALQPPTAWPRRPLTPGPSPNFGRGESCPRAASPSTTAVHDSSPLPNSGEGSGVRAIPGERPGVRAPPEVPRHAGCTASRHALRPREGSPLPAFPRRGRRRSDRLRAPRRGPAQTARGGVHDAGNPQCGRQRGVSRVRRPRLGADGRSARRASLP